MKFLALFCLGLAFNASAADTRRCGAAAVDLSSYRVFVASGRCAMQESHDRAIEMCRSAQYSSGQCVSANMSSDGTPFSRELNQCGSRYLVLACKIDRHRPYCRMGCAGSPELAKSTALEACRMNFAFSGRRCSLQGVQETEEPWDIDSL